MISMSIYANMSKDQLEQELSTQTAHLTACKEQNLKLNMARGKPAKQQRDAVSDILSVITQGDECLMVPWTQEIMANWRVFLLHEFTGLMFWAASPSRRLSVVLQV